MKYGKWDSGAPVMGGERGAARRRSFPRRGARLPVASRRRVGDLGQLLGALRAVADVESVVDPQVVDALVTRRSRLRESPLSRLTPREFDVLREMAQGRGNAGIAAELSLSESSVEKYVNAIFAKLDLASEQLTHRRVAAVLTFLRDAGLHAPGQRPPGRPLRIGREVLLDHHQVNVLVAGGAPPMA